MAKQKTEYTYSVLLRDKGSSVRGYVKADTMTVNHRGDLIFVSQARIIACFRTGIWLEARQMEEATNA